MPQDLTVATIDRLRAIASSGDPARAYQELANLGYNYAELAKGVVTGDTVFGAAAGNFARNAAASQGRPISTQQFRQINRQLFEEYAVALRNSANSSGIVRSDINYTTALAFHSRVFTSNGLSPSTWTLYEPGRILGAASVERQWLGLTSRSSVQVSASFATLALKAESTSYFAAFAWEIDVVRAGGGALVDLSSNLLPKGPSFLPLSFVGSQSGGLSITASSVSFLPDARTFAAQRQAFINAIVEETVPFASTILVQFGGTALDAATAQANLLARQDAVARATTFVDSRYNPNAPIRLSVTQEDIPPANPTPGSLNFASFASSFGSILGRTLGGSSLVIGTVAGAVISAAALSIGQQLFGVNAYPTLSGTIKGQIPRTSTSGVLNDLGNNIGVSLFNAGVGAVSSYLTLELGQALGLSGFGAGLFSAGVGGLLSHVVTNVASGASLFSGVIVRNAVAGSTTALGPINAAATLSNVGNIAAAGFASFFGQQLAQLVITPKTPAQAVFASLGAAALSIFGGKAIAGLVTQVFGKLGALGGPVGILIGTFVGFIVGALFGKLFGKPKPRIPTASAETILQIPNARYAIGAELSANGGDLAFVDAVAVAARDTLNGVIQLVAGGPGIALFVSNTISPTQTYGLTGSQIYVKLGVGAAATNVATADQAVDKGVLFALPQTKIIGGDIILKRAIANSQAPSVTALLGDLQTAKDYETYLAAAPAIDAAISAAYNNLSASDKVFYTANKSFITRALSKSEVPLGTIDQAFYVANQAQVDRIIAGTRVSSFAAAYLVTLVRAGELNLDQFGVSDFYGGLQGFTQSFNVADKGQGVHYEDVSVSLSAGNLTITASGANAAGTFSLLPQANADGTSVTIAGFGANVGYTVQAIGAVTAGTDFESAAGSATAVTVGPGVAASRGYVPQIGIYYDIPATNTGDDIIIGGNAGDSLSAGAGNVWIDGGAGNDVIYGGAGRDVLLGGDGADSITAGAGDTYLSGGAGNDTLIGGSGKNVFVGNAGSDNQTGGINDDIFIVDQHGAGDVDTINGAGGSNTISYERRTSGATIALTGGAQNVYGDNISNIQNVTGSSFADAITASSVSGTLKGLDGNDNLQGGAGNDVLEGGIGADIVAGNGGNNTASYNDSSAGVYVNLATGTTIGGDATGDVLSNIQNLTGSNYGDELAGDAGINVINTGIGDDFIGATAGADTYNGGDGFDTVDYSLTNFVAGSGTVYGYLPYAPYYYSYTGTISAVAVTLTATSGSVTYRNPDGTTSTHALSSIEQLIGTASNDSFSSAGTTLNITWDGSGGSDTYSGGTGSDTYAYGLNYGVSTITDSNAASNTIRLKSGVTFDNLWVANSSGSLQVGIRGSSSYIQANSNFATVGNNVIKFLDLSGSGQVDITQASTVAVGTDGADTLYGGSTTSNIIFAYNGNDTIYASNGVYSQSGNVIYGGLGNDIITTSVGDDQFLFERGNGQDTVYDSGGQNSLIFGPTAGTNDVIYQVVGNDLYVGLADLNNGSLTASQVADSVKFVGAGVVLHDTRTNIDTRSTSIIVQVGGITTDLSKADINWTIQNYTSTPPGGGGGGGGGCPRCAIPPVVFDLTGDGLQITPVAQSDIVTRDDKGNILRSAWIGPTNGILAFDRNSDGKINNTDDISFVQDKAGATTDLEGLAGLDTNNDGILDAKDEKFSKLVVWVDENQDGRASKKEVKTLAEIGIASITLAGKSTGFDATDTLDSVVRNTTSFTRTDGTKGTAYDVALARQTLSGLPAALVGASVDLSASATFGQLKSSPKNLASLSGVIGSQPSVAQQSAIADVDFSDNGGSLSAAAATRWADYLDPARIKLRREREAAGSSGDDNLATIRSTLARADDGSVLIGRGSRDPKTRLQALVIDFNRNGADLIDAKKSNTLVDVNRDGIADKIGWVKSSDGILAFDRNGDGLIDAGTEVSFTGDLPNARTSLQGLGGFDTNSDGSISASDTGFAKFLIWRDVNKDGVSDAGELQSLEQAGVSQIVLTGAQSRPDRGVGSANTVLGVSEIRFTDGSKRAIYDVGLGFADSKEDELQGSALPSGKINNSIASPANPTPGNSQANGVGTQSNAASALNGTSAGIGLARGAQDGPAGITVEANSAALDDSQWWRNPTQVGTGLASLVSSLNTDGRSLGANNNSLVANDGTNDAAAIQRQQLLRQAIASLQPNSGGSAAVWQRGAGVDTSSLTASIPRAASQSALQSATGG